MIDVPNNMILREIREDLLDHVFLVDLHNDPVVLRNVTHPKPVTMHSHMLWWDKTRKDPSQRRYIFEVDGQSVGVAKFYGVDYENWNCVLGADIHKDHRGKGYAKYLWALMLEICFVDLAFHRVSLSTASFNDVGQHLYKKLGFKEEGRLVDSLYRDGKYHDQILMYILRDDYYG